MLRTHVYAPRVTNSEFEQDETVLGKPLVGAEARKRALEREARSISLPTTEPLRIWEETEDPHGGCFAPCRMRRFGRARYG